MPNYESTPTPRSGLDCPICVMFALEAFLEEQLISDKCVSRFSFIERLCRSGLVPCHRYLHIYTSIYLYIYIYIYICICTYIFMNICICIDMFIDLSMYIYIYIYIYAHIHIYIVLLPGLCEAARAKPLKTTRSSVWPNACHRKGETLDFALQSSLYFYRKGGICVILRMPCAIFVWNNREGWCWMVS